MSLAEIIRVEIGTAGPMPFARFMELALYHPSHGYYASGRARVGRGGDFFTNVSIGPFFGRLLARQFAEMWRLLGGPAEFHIVEQGAHGGDFAADALGGLRGFAPECFDATRYRIIEPFTPLEERQRARLAEFSGKVEWHASLAPFAGVHFSNELPDAMPVHVVCWDGAAWGERCVGISEHGFAFTNAPLSSPALSAACAQIPQPLPPGYTTEVSLAARAWIADVAANLTRGWVLAIDYGFRREDLYAPGRTDGTLTARAAHRREPDPLARPGELDLTAHVDFDALIEASGLRMAGLADQHHFMVGLGEGHFADGANARDVRAFQTLMHPELMGQSFKALALMKGADGHLAGFRYARG